LRGPSGRSALIVGHVVKSLGVDKAKLDLEGYDLSGSRRRHMQIIRDRLEVKRYDTIAEQMVIEVVEEAAQHKEDLADIVNVAIEELVRQSYELPGFTVLLRMARQARAELNRCFPVAGVGPNSAPTLLSAVPLP